MKTLHQVVLLCLYSHCFSEGGKEGQGHAAQKDLAVEDQDLVASDGSLAVLKEDHVVQGESLVVLKEGAGVDHAAPKEEVDPLAQEERVPGKKRLYISDQVTSSN